MSRDVAEWPQRLARLGHDARNPLNVLVLTARRLLFAPSLDEDTRRGLARIVEQAQKLETVLGEQLDPLIGVAPEPEAPQPEVPRTTGSRANVLLVEDSNAQAAEVRAELQRASPGEFGLTHVTCLRDAKERLRTETFDLVLLDLFLPDSHGLDSVAEIRTVAPAVPVVVLTGAGDRSTGLEAVRRGAQDVLLKSHADGETVSRALWYAKERAELQAERNRLVAQLESALADVKRLSGLLPICAACKRIRDVGGGWQPIESYIHAHSEADFSHTYCEDCARRALREQL